jgi:hypothetical protein
MKRMLGRRALSAAAIPSPVIDRMRVARFRRDGFMREVFSISGMPGIFPRIYGKFQAITHPFPAEA